LIFWLLHDDLIALDVVHVAQFSHLRKVNKGWM